MPCPRGAQSRTYPAGAPVRPWNETSLPAVRKAGLPFCSGWTFNSKQPPPGEPPPGSSSRDPCLVEALAGRSGWASDRAGPPTLRQYGQIRMMWIPGPWACETCRARGLARWDRTVKHTVPQHRPLPWGRVKSCEPPASPRRTLALPRRYMTGIVEDRDHRLPIGRGPGLLTGARPLKRRPGYSLTRPDPARSARPAMDTPV